MSDCSKFGGKLEMCAKKAVRQIVKQRLPRRREKEEDASLIMRPKEKHCHLAVHKGYLNSQLHGIGMTITLYNLDIASTNFVVGGNDGMMSSRKSQDIFQQSPSCRLL